ncbi:hypothetical protein A3H85_02840 [Candidatus Daviesbacteria bacterium RIFCSPLOWO2_02_FULL_40_8]|uniref:Uncharacterized protein n=1 Tax=Candidatus Daviesbacteria bacterium RIFCSPLOWO2_01_FULL_40_24 TaxID=1797787 RepID=A0A1F5MJ64_9BACT|nr:MAG: hypothetical protein A2780_01500 [Candidatus Daviesbacteria bacterium RIFCSPHIGHO2_01_FULL_41_45]OGE34923.1 MAG: hypothetical protein A3C32_02825 [Candidatus Daviesbacteria bacterium RIFCSPHIGHO2_02_FULL_41_14]OGE65330.1 MAG: hypothetical protein A3B49_03540 [Candidatus Daviesbacteria bacterium RIFCSPLOWO2_01_FULL_40_24]OGE67127.1 MAG: hypothetical protein A3H85_02840 [Candidatus Daviesbacteria bacterium RIFCSPLOWO2_02_FULL_40_8]
MAKPTLDRTVEVPLEMLRELLTDSELRMIKQRFLILNLLEEGNSIRSIASQVGVGTDTVVRVARLTEKKNLRKNIKKSEAPKLTKTSWIFGKTE